MRKIQKTVWVAAILLLLCSFSINAQQSYQTREGIVQVIGSYRDSIVIANSDHLFVLLNYQNAEIVLSLDLATLRTETESLNVTLINLPQKPILLEGKLNIPYVNTLQHPDQELNFTAQLRMNKIVNTIYANGVLKQITSTETFSSMLTINFKLRLSDFKIFVPEDWSDEITIRIYQALLKDQ
ncbi:hypothetical protein [Flavobacterium sp. W22_SRS_FP1]|uniref:hypothetical protein n=1 Tax=Flavobacterium sp. W22_SRS_FP1 TaxID=3240276 RepID=UPI003F922D95